MNISTIKYYCTVNGPGVRTALFVSGCRLHCKGCFNKAAWDFKSGTEMTDEIIDNILESIDHDYIDGLSILGGEPMDENNQEGVWYVIQKFRDKFGDTKSIWMWSGYYKDDAPKTEFTDKIFSEINVLVDGPFKQELYDKNLMWAGSSNQHVIDLKKI